MTDGPTLKHRAVAYLARREHSRAELVRKLSPHGTAEDIETVLNALEDKNLLSDARFTAAFVQSRASRMGATRLRHELKQKGVAPELIENQLASDDLPSEFERARGVWQKKFAVAPVDGKEWAKQARFLQSRGFSTDIIRRLLKETDE